MSAEYGFKVKMDLIRPVLDFCVPVFIYSILVWVVNNIDRFVILHFIPDTSFVGIFDIAVKITLFIEILQMGLMNTINPKIYAIWKDQNLRESSLEVNRYYNGFTAMTLLVIPVILIAIPVLLPLVIKKPIYYQSLVYLPVLCLGFVTRCWFYMFLAPIYFFKKTRILPKIFLLSAIIQIVSSILLVKYFGIMGAVWANFIIKPVQAFLLFTEARKIFRFNVNRWKVLYLPVIFIIMGIISEVIATGQTRVILETGQFCLTVLLVILIYRRELVPLIRQWIRV